VSSTSGAAAGAGRETGTDTPSTASGATSAAAAPAGVHRPAAEGAAGTAGPAPEPGAFPGSVARVGAAEDVMDAVPPPVTQEEAPASRAATALALVAMAALGIGVAVVGPSYGLSVDGQRIGPGFLPLVAGGGLALLALALLAGTLRKAAIERRERDGVAAERIDPHSEETVDDLGRTMARRQRNMRLVSVALLLTILLIPLIGFLEAFALMMLFVSIVVERRPVVASVIIALVAVAVTYAIFVLFLNVRLPMGLLAYLDLR
jgi:putative tricarboxylic transport membrane protein